MWIFLIPLLFGFACNIASAFTAAFSRRWGEKRGSWITAILRNVLGIPVWAIGFILAVRASAPRLFPSILATDVMGWGLISGGGMIIVIALLYIGSKAAKPSSRDQLVQSGIYARVRHPIHSGTLLEFIGLFLILPTATIALACVLGVLWVLIQTKVEEIDLLQRNPNYREYMNMVPCFIPRLRTKAID